MVESVNLKSIRESFNLTQLELAERLGVERRTVQKYEQTGLTPLSIQKLITHEFYVSGGKKFSSEKVRMMQEINYLKKLVKTHEERIIELQNELDNKPVTF